MRIIAGSLRGRLLKTVESPGCRPAMSKVRGALYSMLEARGVVWSGSRVLDLFAGTGSVGFESLSRGAAYACFVESEKRVAACLAENVRKLDLPGGTFRIAEQTVEHFLKKRHDAPYDVIFADPPYGGGFLAKTLTAVVKGGWLAEGGILAAEVESGLRVPEHATLLPLMDRSYGQTRILLWTHLTDTLPSTPEPSTL